MYVSQALLLACCPSGMTLKLSIYLHNGYTCRVAYILYLQINTLVSLCKQMYTYLIVVRESSCTHFSVLHLTAELMWLSVVCIFNACLSLHISIHFREHQPHSLLGHIILCACVCVHVSIHSVGLLPRMHLCIHSAVTRSVCMFVHPRTWCVNVADVALLYVCRVLFTKHRCCWLQHCE